MSSRPRRVPSPQLAGITLYGQRASDLLVLVDARPYESSPLAVLRVHVVADVVRRKALRQGRSVRYTAVATALEEGNSDASAVQRFQRDLALLGAETPERLPNTPQHGVHAAGDRTVLPVARVVAAQRSDDVQLSATTFEDLSDGSMPPRAYRLLLLEGHYRQRCVLTSEALRFAASAYDRLAAWTGSLGGTPRARASRRASELEREFQQAIESDLNTPRALSVLWSALKDAELERGDKLRLVRAFDDVLGLDLIEAARLRPASGRAPSLSPAVMQLVERRSEARRARDFARADALRLELRRLGFLIEDSSDGTRIRPAALDASITPRRPGARVSRSRRAFAARPE